MALRVGKERVSSSSSGENLLESDVLCKGTIAEDVSDGEELVLKPRSALTGSDMTRLSISSNTIYLSCSY